MCLVKNGCDQLVCETLKSAECMNGADVACDAVIFGKTNIPYMFNFYICQSTAVVFVRPPAVARRTL